MLRNLLTVLFLTSLSTLTFSQTITSAQSGDWDDPNTWNGGIIPDNGNSTLVSVAAGHIVTVSSNETVINLLITSNVNSRLIISETGQLDITGTLTLGTTANRGRAEIAGILQMSDGSTIANGSPLRLIIQNGGTYRLNYTSGGVIYDANFQSGSILEFTGYSDGAAVAPTLAVSPKVFHHVVWNCVSQGTDIDLGGILTTINGDFRILSTGPDFWFLMITDITDVEITIGGDFEISNDSYVYLSGYSGDANVTLNVLGSASVNIDPGYAFVLSGSGGSSIMNIDGNLNINSPSGLVYLTESGGDASVNLLGNFSLTAGTLTKSGSGIANLNFIGSATHSFSNTGSINNTINYSVASLSTLSLGVSSLTGSGTLTVNGSGRLSLGSLDASGALQNGSSGGNIRVTGTRTYSSTSTIEYNGSGPQFIGNGFPPSGDVNLVINNSSGVTLSDNLEILALRTLTLQAGNLVIGTQTLTINGTVTGSGGLIGGPSSNVVIGGTGNFGTLTFNGTSELLNFTVNRTSSGVVTLGGDLTVLGTLTQTAGDIVLNGNTLTLSGNFGRTSGNLVVDGASSLIVNGSGSLPPTVGLSGSSLQTLTLDRASSSFPFSASVTITNLNLIDGSLVNGTGLQITTGGTITRNAGTMSTSPGGSNLYNLDYITSGAINTGPEFHSNDARVDNVEMNGGGTVTLSADRTINGDLILSSGDFNIGSNTLTLEGNLIANSSSTLTGGTVVFDGNTTISGSAVPTFGNIQVNNTRSLTFPPGDFDVAGNVLFEAGSTINSGTGTLLLSGGAAQSISGGGVSISNIRVDKISGADVELTSPLIITGALRVVSANSNFASDGNLVLRSTSDGTSNNARIGQLLNGASVSGDVTVERFMSAEGRIYRYISTPVSGFSVAELQLDFPVTGSFTGTSVCAGCTTNQSMFSYNGATQAYEDFPASSNTETLSAGVGYAAFIRQDVIGPPVTIDWTGPINQGTVPLPVSYNGTAESWNLVGNPYPSSIDWDNSGWTKTSIAGSISVRNNNTGMFQTWNGATGSLPNGVIATGQAFWVRTTGVTPSLQVTEPVKTTVTGEFFRKASDELNQFILTLSDGTVEDQAFYWVSEMASAGLDDYDAIKLNNFRDVGSVPLMDLATYSYDENPLPMAINSVNRVNCGDIVKVYTKDLIQGNYELSFSASGFISNLTWILKDNFTGTQINLSQNPIYGFVVTDEETSKAVDRFELSIAFNPVELTTYGNTLISNYETGNQWYLNGVLLEGETDKELVASESGLYTLEVNINGCISTTDRQFVVTNIENSIERTIRVYPNPTNDRFKLEVDSAEPVKARLFNTIGVEVTAVEMADSALTKNAEFDLSNQSNGIYILHVQKGGRVHQVKIIKTNK